MLLNLEAYSAQKNRWPRSGQVLLAQFDSESIVVYQAYRPAIGLFAAKHGYFGEGFKTDRMTWIKPNFLWMMYRSGWGTKTDQETVLAIHIRRSAFDAVLEAAVHSSFKPSVYTDEADWRQQLSKSEVRLQWDPDHDPMGNSVERRAIQLGLKGSVASAYSHEWIVRIEDISPFVAEQRNYISSADQRKLLTPHEEIYPVFNSLLAQRLGVE